MLIDIVNRIFYIIFFMSLLHVIRHTYYFIQVWVKSANNTEKYKLSNNSLLLLSMSISYLISAIFNGITLS